MARTAKTRAARKVISHPLNSGTSDRDIAPVAHTAVTFFDGGEGPTNATLRFAAALEILVGGRCVAAWPYAEIHRLEGPQDAFRIGCRSAPSASRLEIRDDIVKHEILARAGLKDIPPEPLHRDKTAVFVWSLAAIIAAAALLLLGIPYAAGAIAPLIPQSVESRLGEIADFQVRSTFKGKACTGAAGAAAFAKLVQKVGDAGGLDIDLTTRVLDVAVPNAFALPGGRVYLFSGLLARAQNADELAGVIAHELGHVHHHDHLRGMIRYGGTAFVVGLILGDITGAAAAGTATRAVLNASNSREVEAQADTFAIAAMHRLGRSPAALGELLFRITGAQAGRSVGILASHPLTEARREAMRAADRPPTGPELLSREEWQALRALCTN
jgi:Zn-dependent protease with chaperone function